MIRPGRFLTAIIRKHLARLLIVALSYSCIILFYNSGALEFLELYAYDKFLQHYPEDANYPESPMTVITITENDINRLNRWPISDHSLANILEKLIHYKSRVIGIDIYRDTPVPPGHMKLESILQQSNIIAAMKYSETESSRVNPPPVLQDSQQFGFIDVLPDKDGIVRRGLLFLDNGTELFYSFPLRIALMYLQADGVTPRSDSTYLTFNSTTITPFKTNDGGYVNADANGYQFLLDFCKPSRLIPRYTLKQFRQGKTRIEDFRDKIVLIGVVAESVKDFYYTPCNRDSTENTQVSGVMMHAAIIDQLLRVAQNKSLPITTAADWQEKLWILIWILLGVFISQRSSSLSQLVMIWTAGLVAISGLSLYLFTQGLWLIVVTPATAWLLSSILATAQKSTQEKRMRTQLMNLFSKHVSPEVAKDIWQKHELFSTEGRPRPQQTTATIMFTDLQHFTALSEMLEPAALFDWLNEYLAGMTPLVANHGGIVIRFFGDAIFAGFGIPVPRTSVDEIRQDANHAVCCALAMNEKLAQLNKQWKQRGLPTVGMRIGIASGQIATGSIGDFERMEYTVHGDTVNTAARLESYNKPEFHPNHFKQPCRILIDEPLIDYLGHGFRLECLGKTQLRGKTDNVKIYRVTEKI